ncbi:hypothetical protein E3N88_13778 [Mikania micrantha]|uniref:Uncharacterized protein n=1 Tax=Mikania micrantha TaxID=192012 RepID=A0A5N6P0S1_9ASTR|nr:hypothetical protein E3N88_13778 [Mikania micrantha]
MAESDAANKLLATGVKEGSNLPFQCPTLTATNYPIWSLSIKAIFKAHGIWEVIEPGINVDARKDNSAIAYLYQPLPEDLVLQIANCQHAKEIWDAIKTRYLGVEHVMEARLQTLKAEFEAASMKETEGINDFAAKLSGIASKSAALGTLIDESTLVRKLLTAVPERFLNIAATIEQLVDLRTARFQEIVGRLKAYEERTAGRSSGNGHDQLLLSYEEWDARKRQEKYQGKGRGGGSDGRGRGRGRCITILCSQQSDSSRQETDAEERSQLAQKMESWKMALTEIADLKGRDVKDRKETEFIQEVVADIHRRLPVPLGNTLPPFIRMDNEIWSIRSWLTDGSSNTVDILTVVGVGGIGKTSLAKYVFQLHSNKFQKSSFIEGINETCKKNLNGMLDLQKQLFGDISKNIQLQIHDVSIYASKIKNALAHKKVLLVLDDVGCLDQLDALHGNEPFHKGSKIIITTKDASLTERCALFDLRVQPKHEKISLKGLYKSASLELLCIHAFKSNKPEKGYEEASEKLVEPVKDIHWLLKFWADRDVAETILNSCDLNARYGITNLIERCLLSIDSNNVLEMHSLIQEMGRDLVRQESPDKPWERSRLWCHEESFKVLEQKQGTGNLVGLALDMRMLEKEKLSGCLQLKTDALSKMDKLKLLLLNYVKINGSYENVPKELRWLCMHGFHLKSIPSELPLEKVVVLDMSYSKIESFDMSYSRSQQFVSRLKILDLSFCELLHSVGGFYLLPALERLILKNCTSLIEVCESIEQCDELVHIDLRYCCKIKKLPKSLCKLKKVQTLLLDGCISRETQIQMGNMNVIPSDSKFFLISLPRLLRTLSLANNNLSNECFPMDLSCLAMLKELRLDGNPIVSMPDCVRTLPRLEMLGMKNCDKLILIEHPPCTLNELKVDFYFNVEDNHSIRKMKFDPEMPPSLDISAKITNRTILYDCSWSGVKYIVEIVLNTLKLGGRPIECETQMEYSAQFIRGEKCQSVGLVVYDDDGMDEGQDVLGY